MVDAVTVYFDAVKSEYQYLYHGEIDIPGLIDVPEHCRRTYIVPEGSRGNDVCLDVADLLLG